MTKTQDTKPIKPKPVGYWNIPGSDNRSSTMFPLYRKPNKLQRFAVRLLLGWVWKEAV